jgi:hypothetical protein
MPKQTQKEKLAKDALRASRIEQTLGTNGWKDIQEIIQAKYDDCMNDLLRKENPEARGAINAIVEIMNDISQELQFGETARKKYTDRYLKNQTPEGG